MREGVLERGVLASAVRLDGPAGVGSDESGARVMAVVWKSRVGQRARRMLWLFRAVGRGAKL